MKQAAVQRVEADLEDLLGIVRAAEARRTVPVGGEFEDVTVLTLDDPICRNTHQLAEFGVGGHSFADDPAGCCVERAWNGRAAAGGRVALGRGVPKLGILKRIQL